MNIWFNFDDWFTWSISPESKFIYLALTRVTENTEHDANDLFEHLDITQELFEECISELEDNDLVYVKEISDCVLFVLGSKKHSAKAAYERYLETYDDIQQ